MPKNTSLRGDLKDASIKEKSLETRHMPFNGKKHQTARGITSKFYHSPVNIRLISQEMV